MNLALFIIFLIPVESARILGIFPAPGYSQFILAETLMKELTFRGHEVTVISVYEPKKSPPNYKTILVKEVLESIENNVNYVELGSSNLFAQIFGCYEYGDYITYNTLRNKKVQKLLHSNEKFDLVIMEHLPIDALKGFAAHFNAPLVLFAAMGITDWYVYPMELPLFPTFNAVTYADHSNTMTFFQRIKNCIAATFDDLYRRYFYFPKQREYLKRYFPRYIDLDHVLTNASLMLLNSHVTLSENVLLPSNMIEIGGFHITEANPLDKEMQQFLDNAADGVVLFSLGSNVKFSHLPQKSLDAILTVLGNLKQKVLLKLDTDLPNKPKNVFVSKWFKQSDILAHSNVKLFITHGGLLSTTEAVYHEVPMLGIPIFLDQNLNMARAHRLGIANRIRLNDINEETFFQIINETLSNPKYSSNIKKISRIIKDRPMKPLDVAMYWIEFVLRHSHTHFKPASSQLYWFQIYMLDILCFILFIAWFLFKLFMLVFSKKSSVVKLKQQ